MTVASRALPRLAPLALAAAAGLLGAVRSSHADAPPGHYQDAPSGDGVLDTKTGLIWGPNSVNLNPPYLPWQAAKDTCSSLGGPWRLPTYKELSSLVDETAPSGMAAIDLNWFPGTPPQQFWTSSVVSGTNGVWVVAFSIGNTTPVGDPGAMRWVRCVRSAP